MANTLMRKRPSDDLITELSEMTRHITDVAKTEFDNLSTEQLFWQPDKNSWSIAQCFAHLNAFHRFYVPTFVERIKNSRFQEPADYFQSSPLGHSTYMKVKLGKLKNVKRKLISPKDYNPLVNKNLKIDTVMEDFYKYQDRLLEVMESARKINIRKTKTSFSVRPIVKLRLGDAFQYIVYHAERHIEQARKVKNHPRFPK
ncbi:DinB family protein [Paracrocinitomix mangrovi]|uniref:DinB family protein n=1 Tax=Paracrocinitomix mangrovi TaxID=2862509 RepID=UPI001C8E4B72|nr:DinB family protein [Paracrocinitomix mangrovi]UKN02609.1 DinB family protein [Paracrocinitomix mangrovi]